MPISQWWIISAQGPARAIRINVSANFDCLNKVVGQRGMACDVLFAIKVRLWGLNARFLLPHSKRFDRHVLSHRAMWML